MKKYAVIETPRKNTGTYILISFIVLLVAGCVYFYSQWQSEKEKAQITNTILEQNQAAMHDSLRVINDKFNNLMTVTYAYMSTIDNLTAYNQELMNKIRAVEGNVLSAIDNSVSYVQDSITIANTIEKYSATDYGLKFNYLYQDEGIDQKLSGVSKFSISDNVLYPGQTDILYNSLDLDIFYGFREVDNKYEVFAQSKSPYVRFNELEGVLILDKFNKVVTQKRTHFAYGPIGGLGYSMVGNRIDFLFGFGVIYKLGEF